MTVHSEQQQKYYQVSHPAPGRMVRLWSGPTECPTSHSLVAISLPGIVLRFSYPTLTGILLWAYVCRTGHMAHGGTDFASSVICRHLKQKLKLISANRNYI